MKKLVSMVLLVCIVSAFAIAEKTVAVATFDVAGNAVSNDEAETITELYIAELVATGKVVITDRANFSKLLAELKFQGSDWSDSAKTAKLGKAINAKFISRGKIMKLGHKYYLSATILDVTTAKILSSAKIEFYNLDEIFTSLRKFVDKLIEDLPYQSVGDRGLKGGTIFYISDTDYVSFDKDANTVKCFEVIFLPDVVYRFDDAKALENSEEVVLREDDIDAPWLGLYEWHLPTKMQFEMIFNNLLLDSKGYLQNKSFEGFYCVADSDKYFGTINKHQNGSYSGFRYYDSVKEGVKVCLVCEYYMDKKTGFIWPEKEGR